MTENITKLRETILEAVQRARLGRAVEDVAVEPDVDEEGNEFLRVLIKVSSKDPPRDEELEVLLEGIEAAVLDVDSRYPSVRFLDAA